MPSKSVATKPPASGSEDEIGPSDQENPRPAPPKINRTPEPIMEPAPKPKQRKRVLKKDLVAKNATPAQEPEPVPELESVPAPVPAKKTTKSTKAKAEAGEVNEKPVAKSKPKTKRAPSPEPAPVIPETQPEPTEIDQSIVEDEPPVDLMDIDREPSPPPPPPPPPPPKSHTRQRSASIQRQAAPGAVYSRARSTSRQPGTYSRGRSASDTERRVAESEANRRLADMTKKYEEMRMKYDSELAELRKTSSATISESAKLQSQVAALTAENDKLKEEHKATVTSLTESQNESKALTAKLEAARKTNAASDKVPGSAVKKIEHGKTHGASAESVKENALKEELYRDLTGLIITSVKRKDGEDEYSCIQTGRNGKFAYEPLLDANRDADLMDILPDYLTEEICFPRNHAVKFYTKVVESMTKRVVVDED
ncbi:unnamed protein product [Aureobasidium uvarum]|uniref:Monopolin complex subunit Csm1/Pcs1 C-terminal domain-containing protein n=1 Tax=Aureobasidium uvarum TaxID=2773716 RepID=A0A9N8KI45_9PEZI|nr:unnamed protein product [Aureobasidium uvarum]